MTISLNVFYISTFTVEIWCQHWYIEQNYVLWEEKHPSMTQLPYHSMLWKGSTEPKWSNTNNKILCTIFFSIFISKVNMEMKKNLTSCSLKFHCKIIIGCQQYSCPCFCSLLSHSLYIEWLLCVRYLWKKKSLLKSFLKLPLNFLVRDNNDNWKMKELTVYHPGRMWKHNSRQEDMLLWPF